MQHRINKSIALAFTTAIFLVTSVFAQESEPRKDATNTTKKANAELHQELPFSDKSDFEAAHKGFIAPLPTEMIKGEKGNAVWNPEQYNFIKEGKEAPATVNPSLWRQSQLINISGLFKVTEGIYQVRNLDLSNMTIIEGDEGITVVDPLVSKETAKVGWTFITKIGARSRSKQSSTPIATLTITAAFAA